MQCSNLISSHVPAPKTRRSSLKHKNSIRTLIKIDYVKLLNAIVPEWLPLNIAQTGRFSCVPSGRRSKAIKSHFYEAQLKKWEGTVGTARKTCYGYIVPDDKAKICQNCVQAVSRYEKEVRTRFIGRPTLNTCCFCWAFSVFVTKAHGAFAKISHRIKMHSVGRAFLITSINWLIGLWKIVVAHVWSLN